MCEQPPLGMVQILENTEFSEIIVDSLSLKEPKYEAR